MAELAAALAGIAPGLRARNEQLRGECGEARAAADGLARTAGDPAALERRNCELRRENAELRRRLLAQVPEPADGADALGACLGDLIRRCLVPGSEGDADGE
jgi:hypothetical protein